MTYEIERTSAMFDLTPYEAPQLNLSHYRTVAGVGQKSCPRCSVNAGELKFYPLLDFGDRQMAPGVSVVQTWCKRCR